MRWMANHIRRQIFKINDNLQLEVPKGILQQAMTAEK